jgi:hypothetical protein
MLDEACLPPELHLDALHRFPQRRPDRTVYLPADRAGQFGRPASGSQLVVLDEFALDHELDALGSWAPVARRNASCLAAMRRGAVAIYETDDNGVHHDEVPDALQRAVSGVYCSQRGWVNVCRYFSDAGVWPLGFPPELLHAAFNAELATQVRERVDCPVQHHSFDADGSAALDSQKLILGPQSWCPFGALGTLWWDVAFPLLYLPSCAPFRMPGLWRSLVAQVCLHAAGCHVAFRSLTGTASHSRMDTRDAVSGCLNSRRIVAILGRLQLASAPDAMGESLRACYRALVEAELIPAAELALVDRWLMLVDELAPLPTRPH